MTTAIPVIATDSVAHAAEALRRCAHMIAFRADIDIASLYRDGRGNEASYWRHVWWYVTRTGADVREADMERALDLKHGTITPACHKIEDERDEITPELGDWLDARCAELAEALAQGATFRRKIDQARRGRGG